MTDYRYIFGTLRTEQVIEEIPLYGVIMNMTINRGGDFQGTFQLDQTGKNNDDLLSACIPGRCWVTCERNGQPVWHGYIWSRVYSAQSKSVQLFAQSFENYPKKRINHEDITYVGQEQRNIFNDLWNRMQTPLGGNLNVIVPGPFPLVVSKDLAVKAVDFKAYDNIMSSISDGADGFDWYIQITKDGMLYRKDLTIGYPTLGTSISDGMTVFEYPGNITQYYFTEPMADAGTDIYLLGAGEGSDMIVGTAFDTAAITSGSPIWEEVVSRKDINNQAIADSLAHQELAARRPPMAVAKLFVKANLTPEFGSYNLGDTCRIVIKDPRFPNFGFNGFKRLLKWELTPQSSGSTEEAQLVFEGDPDL
jgi:hypothetical protein